MSEPKPSDQTPSKQSHWTFRRPTRAMALTTSAALLGISALIWESPAPRTFGGGPTATEVALQRQQARADDLKSRLVALTARVRKGRPVQLDMVAAARAGDLKEQVDDLTRRLSAPRPTTRDAVAAARARDLKKQVDLLTAKIVAGHPGPDQKLRADDLKKQLEALTTGPDKRAEELRTALLDAQASLATTYQALGAEKDAQAMLKARAAALRALVDEADTKLADSYAALGQARNETSTATASVTALQKELAAARVRTAAVFTDLGAMQAQARDAALRADDLKRQLDEATAELSRPRPVVVPPAVAFATKDQIQRSRDLFGLYTAQSPFDFGEYDGVEQAVKRNSDITGYFQSWADDFRPDAVEDAWRKGHIPLMTWESQDQIGVVASSQSTYTMSNIYGGQFDSYLHRYAAGIKALGLPLIIRFDHEMNGSWYPWSEIRGWDGGSVNGNHRGDYVKMWRHVHDIFQAEGANDYVIWLWSPNRVNKIPSQPEPMTFYPGDDYVDWVGMSGYYRVGDQVPTFDGTYAQTLALYRAPLAFPAPVGKPIFLSEIGAADAAGHKADWITSFFSRLKDADNSDIIGFGWFNLVVSEDDSTNDWRAASTGPTGRAFAAGVDALGWGRGR